MLPKITDVAWELAEFSKWSNKLSSVNGAVPFFEVIAEKTQVDPSHPLFFSMLGAIVKRVGRLGSLRVKYLDGKLIDEEENQSLINASASLSFLLMPNNLVMAWSAPGRQRVKDADIIALQSFSDKIRDSHPLRRLLDADIAEVCSKIDQSYKSTFDDVEIEPWMKEIVCNGLLELRWTVQHLRFFGHDKLFDELILVQEKIERLGSSSDSVNLKTKLFNVINTIVLIVNFVVAPDIIYTAYSHYSIILKGNQETQALFPRSGSEKPSDPPKPKSAPIDPPSTNHNLLLPPPTSNV